MSKKKAKIGLSFFENGKNGGPYISHSRIMHSCLTNSYDFIPIYFPRLRKLLNPAVFISMIKTVRKADVDVFQFSGLQLEGFFICLIGKLARAKTICAIRGSTDEAVYVGKMMRNVTDLCEKWTLRHCDVCYGVSDYVTSWDKVKKESKHIFGTIYNFFDFSNNNSEIKAVNRERIRNELGISKDMIIVISTGRIIEEKGYSTIASIITEGNEWGDVVFLIVGDGNYLNTLRQQLNDEIDRKKVILTGYRSDVSELLDASDIFLSCTWHETFGNSILEGSYHYLPVIASRVGGVPEIVCDNKTGFLVDKDNTNGFITCLKYLINDSNLRKNIGLQGYNYVTKKFDPKYIEQRFDLLYQSVIKEEAL